MRSRLLSSAAVAAALLLGGPAVAQITLSADLAEGAIPDKNPDPNLKFTGKVKDADEARVLPNADAAGVFFVYAHNTDVIPRTLVVILTNEATGDVYGEGKAVSVPGDHWQVVKFAKPAAPPAAVPPAPPAPAVAPPPPGLPVARSPKGFDLKATLYAEDPQGGNRKEVKAKAFPVKFLSPTDEKEYLEVGKLRYTKDNKSFSLPLTPKGKTSVTAKLTFTDSKGALLPLPPTGIYTRTLAPGREKQTLDGVEPDAWSRMYLSVDGVERVRVYNQEAFGSQPEVNAEEKRKEVRVVAVGPTTVTRPTAAFPVRVETDNVPPEYRLELRVNRAGAATDDKRGTVPSDEVIPLGGPRDEKVWLDVAEPTKGGLGFATRTTDWVKALDLTNARGKLTVQAVLREKKGDRYEVVAASQEMGYVDLGLTVDAVGPTVSDLTVGDKDKKLEKVTKGKSVPLWATVRDGEAGSDVQKVTFVLYTRLQDDGTFPADAIRVDGVRQPELDKDGKPTATMSYTWRGDLTPPKADTYKIAVVAVDTAGNPSGGGKADPAVKVIQIVDPTPGAGGAGRGFIAGVVFYADRPQPGIFVAVGGPDGKAKAVKLTDERGKFCIDDLPPGAYTVTTFKPSSGKGFAGAADVTVEADKTARVTIEMVRVK